MNNALARSARRRLKVIIINGYIYDVVKDYMSLYDIVTK